MQKRSKATGISKPKFKAFRYVQPKPNEGTYAKYGENDNFPSDVLSVVLASGTAMSCINRLSQFIMADGFTEERLRKESVNVYGETVKGLASKIVMDVAFFSSFAIIVKCDGMGNPKHYYHVSITKLRKKVNERGVTTAIMYNPTIGTTYKKNSWTEYPVYSPLTTSEERLQIIANQIEKYGEQLGFISHFHMHNMSSDVYGVPTYVAGLDDIESDVALQATEKSNIKDGFKADVIVATVDDESGYLDYDVDGGAHVTAEDDIDRALRDLAHGNSRIARISASSKDALPSITPFSNQFILDSIDRARDRVPRAICRHFGVPPILIGLTQPEGLGNAEALANNMKLFMLSVTEIQEWVCNCLKQVMPDKGNIQLTSLNLFDYIPQEYLQDLTVNERRGVIGYSPLKEEEEAAIIEAKETEKTSIFNKFKALFQ